MRNLKRDKRKNSPLGLGVSFDAYNNQGLLQTHSLTTGTNTTNINVSNYISGLYTFVLEVDGIVVSTKHLVVVH